MSYQAESVTYYDPPGGTHFTVKVMRNEKNICHELAEPLYRIANQECLQPGLEGQPFKPNYVYEFANGLTFRLWDDEVGVNDKVLEFYVPPEFQDNKQQVLSRIPQLLKMAGVTEGALVSLNEILQPPRFRV